MKINEVLSEAVNTSTGTPNPNIFQRATGAVKGAVSGFKASQQQRLGRERAQQEAKAWIDKWNQAVGANPSLANNPAALQQYGNQLARDENGRQLFQAPRPTNMSAAGVNDYIANIVGQVTSGVEAQPQPTSVAGVDPVKQVLDRLISKAEAAGDRLFTSDISKELEALDFGPTDRREMINKIADRLKSQGIQVQTGMVGTKPEQDGPPTMDRRVTITSSDPVVLHFKTKNQDQEYALNSRDRWVYFGGTKEASPEMQRFLNKQLRAIQ